MLFASTWRFAFALGMERMNRDLRQQHAAEAAAAEAEDTTDPYLSSSTHFLWSAAAATHDGDDGDGGGGSRRSQCSSDAASSPREEGEDSDDEGAHGGKGAGGSELRPERHKGCRGVGRQGESPSLSRAHRSQREGCAAAGPSPPAAAQGSPVSLPSNGLSSAARAGEGTAPLRGERVWRRRLPPTVLQHVLRFHDSRRTPLALACAAANPSLRLAVEASGSLHIPNGHTWTEVDPAASAEAADVRVVRAPSLENLLSYAAVATWWWRRSATLRRSGAGQLLDHEGTTVSAQRPPPLHLEVSAARAAPNNRSAAEQPAPPPHAARPRRMDPTPLSAAFEQRLSWITRGDRCTVSRLSAPGPRTFPAALLSLSPGLSHLRSLSLPHNKSITDAAAIGQLHWLRELDLSYSSVSDLAALTAAGSPHLMRVNVKGCKALQSLSPLGELPSLVDVVASQSAVSDIDGLSRSRSLISISFYGCLGLRDVSALGAIPTLREVYASESSVTTIYGLGRSRSLAHIGLRYCDVASLEALANTRTLSVLNVSCTPIPSVQCLSLLPMLTRVDLSGCAQLRDIGSLGAVATLRELNACGSGVAVVHGLGRAKKLRSLLLDNCQELRELPGLGACEELEVLAANSCGLTSIAGLKGACSLAKLDISFCRHLEDLSVLFDLPALEKVNLEGCAGAAAFPLREWRISHPHVQVDVDQ